MLDDKATVKNMETTANGRLRNFMALLSAPAQ